MKSLPLVLNRKKSLFLEPRSPYHFDANFHKPSHFPSSDSAWEEGKHWITIVWKGRRLGLKFENRGTVNDPKFKLTIYSRDPLSESYVRNIVREIRWRSNLDQDISDFCNKFRNEKILGPRLKKWRGMKPVAANSLYETLMIYLVLQNATVRRSIQMLENLFERFGRKVKFDGRVLSTFWEPVKMARCSEGELRRLKVGYRARFFRQISEQFVRGAIDEFAIRKMQRERVRNEMSKLYGIGPASLEYLLFEDFYFLDSLEKIPLWEQKILSRLLFNRKLVSAQKILSFFRERYEGYEKLAFHYLWEDLFWKRAHEQIEWLEKEIRR